MLFLLLTIGTLSMTAPPPAPPIPPAVRRMPLPGIAAILPHATACLDPDIAVGQTLDPARRKALADRHGRKLRILHPGDAVTMDMVPDRINILLDLHDRIIALHCG